MNDKDITREGIEKLQSLIPTEEEISCIKDAQKNNQELPLGSAEQFLLILNSINGLDCKLKLWAFKVDFKAIVHTYKPFRLSNIGGVETEPCI